MGRFREKFEAYGGDYQTTLGRFMNREEMYLRFLDMLFQDENLEKLGDALNAGDMRAAFEAAHTLKGVAANMGLQPLLDAVCAIVEPLRQEACGVDYAALYQTIQMEFLRVDRLRQDLKEGE